jgi:hypothetical protein
MQSTWIFTKYVNSIINNYKHSKKDDTPDTFFNYIREFEKSQHYYSNTFVSYSNTYDDIVSYSNTYDDDIDSELYYPLEVYSDVED